MKITELERFKIRLSRVSARPDILKAFATRGRFSEARCVLLDGVKAFRGPRLLQGSVMKLVFERVDLAAGLRVTAWGIIDVRGRLMIRVPTQNRKFTPRVALDVSINWVPDARKKATR